MFIWLNDPYPDGYSYFEPNSWRRAARCRKLPIRVIVRRVRRRSCPRTKPRCARAHKNLLKRLAKIQAEGYLHETLLISMTNEWRIDGDPPFPALADFVAAWHRLGLTPTLRLTTVSTALKDMEHEIGQKIPEFEGEWTDWWANGVASGPREVIASRLAKRTVARRRIERLGTARRPTATRWSTKSTSSFACSTSTPGGHINSIGVPWSLEVIGQYNEKARQAYRPLAQSQLLLSQRIRTKLASAEEGFYVINTSKQPWSGWTRMLTSCLRDEYRSVIDPTHGRSNADRATATVFGLTSAPRARKN